MTASVMQALLGAGIPPADASRISLALDAAYGAPPAPSTKQQYSGEARAEAFALFSSSPSSQLVGSGPEYTGGPAALGIHGLAHFSGQIYASSTAYVGGLLVGGDAAVSMSVSAKKGTFSDGVSVPGGASITPGAMSVIAPLVASGGFVSKGGAQFSGSNLFDGPVTLAGPVNWGGERRPATVEVISFANASASVVRFGRKQISALHDHGDASPGAMTFALQVEQVPNLINAITASTISLTGTRVLTGLAAQSAVVSGLAQNLSAATISAVSQPNLAHNLQQTTALLVGVSVITSVGFDADACAITSAGTLIYGSPSGGSFVSGVSFSEATVWHAGTSGNLVTSVSSSGVSVNSVTTIADQGATIWHATAAGSVISGISTAFTSVFSATTGSVTISVS